MDEKGITTSDTPGGAQQLVTVSEAGLYSLILTSRKPEAKAFKRWVTHAVMVAIRKNGSYVMGEEKVATGELSFEAMAARVIEMAQVKIAHVIRNHHAHLHSRGAVALGVEMA